VIADAIAATAARRKDRLESETEAAVVRRSVASVFSRLIGRVEVLCWWEERRRALFGHPPPRGTATIS
jgi:hypothetical protein